MAEADEPVGVAADGDGVDGEGADEWVAPWPDDVADPRTIDPEPPVAPVAANEEGSGVVDQVVVEGASDEVPPDPGFVVHPDRYGRGVHGYLYNGVPVGNWLDEAHHDLSGRKVRELLISVGASSAVAKKFGEQRDGRIRAESEMARQPGQRGLAIAEARAKERLELVREAFLKKQGKTKR